MNGYLKKLQLRRMCTADGTTRGGMNLQPFVGAGMPDNGEDTIRVEGGTFRLPCRLCSGRNNELRALPAATTTAAGDDT